MTSAYLTRTAGTGALDDPHRPAVSSGSYVCLMIDPAVDRALIVSTSDTLTGTGVSRLLTAADYASLVTLAETTTFSSQRRTAMATWLSAAGYPPLSAEAVTWLDLVNHVAAHVNPGADLRTAYLA